eukprot:10273225-Alexandrium_andersonii.AAC.1
MSASLVGSEMCIRDRPWRRVWSLATSRRAACAASDRTDAAQRVAEQAVSYTHLTLPTICSV